MEVLGLAYSRWRGRRVDNAALSAKTIFLSNSSNLTTICLQVLRAVPSRGRHPDRLQPRMGTARARSHPLEIRAHIVSREVQHLAPEAQISLDLRSGPRRSPSQFAVSIACRRDPPHRR